MEIVYIIDYWGGAVSCFSGLFESEFIHRRGQQETKFPTNVPNFTHWGTSYIAK